MKLSNRPIFTFVTKSVLKTYHGAHLSKIKFLGTYVQVLEFFLQK